MLKFILPGIITMFALYYLSGDLLFVHKGLATTGSDMKNYMDKYDHSNERDVEKRQDDYNSIVPNFYRLVTDFYQYGWGNSFHFAPSFHGESFQQSLARSEHFLSSKLGLGPKDKVLDVGCGVGGPLLEIARFSGAHITCLNIVEYQIEKAHGRAAAAGMLDQVGFLHGDFMKMPVEDSTYDALYGIEATCHSPDKPKLWAEIHRVLKPGGRFAIYEWLMTDKYDPKNPEHNAIKEGIEIGNALPDIPPTSEIQKELEDAGFIVEYIEDRALVTEHEPIPWWSPLGSSFSLQGFMNSQLARKITNTLTFVIEKLGIVDEGAHYTAVMLDKTAKDLVKGGETGIFTPCYFVMARKPE